MLGLAAPLSPCVGGAPHPPGGTHLTGGAGEGTPTVPVPATGGHLHTGAGVATPGTVPRCLPRQGHPMHPGSHHSPLCSGGTQASGRQCRHQAKGFS